jgi:predicted lipid carrier protein YhbT
LNVDVLFAVVIEVTFKGMISTSTIALCGTDVVFSASVDALVLMQSQKIDPDTLLFNRKLKITGDTERGLEIKNMFDQFDLELLDKPFRKVLDAWSDELIHQTSR